MADDGTTPDRDLLDLGTKVLLPGIGLAVGAVWALGQFGLSNFYGDLGLDPGEKHDISGENRDIIAEITEMSRKHKLDIDEVENQLAKIDR